MRGDVSSQFTSALLMALPIVTARASRALTVDIAGELISKPYVAITTHLMERFGVTVEQDGWRSFRVPAGARYASPGTLHVEGDASSASYFLAAGAIGGGPVRVTGVGRAVDPGRRRVRGRARPDGRARSTAATTGSRRVRRPALRGLDVDCTAIPDAAMTLAVVALFARGPTTLTGIASWRVKETDRIAAMATELRKLGATVDAGDDRLTVSPPRAARAGDDRHLRRPPDRDVLFARGAGRRRRAHPRSRLRAQDVSRLLRRVRDRSRRVAASRRA